MEVSISDAGPVEGNSTVVLDKLKLQEVVSTGSLEFDDWTSLISEIEKAFPDELEKIRLVYDGFLSEFPLCYGYWKKYADHVMRLRSVDKVVEIFERAVESATYSVDVWVEYCRLASLVFEDPSDVRRLFMRALSFVGKDFLCYKLWDTYIEFEFSHRNWSSLAQIYIEVLRFPTKKLHLYYDSFRKLVGIWEEEMKSHGNSTLETSNELKLDCAVPTSYKQDEIAGIVKELLDPSNGLARFRALQRYISIGEWLHQESSLLNEKINLFETHIRRSYFHPKPLDYSQLENWHQYLDFAESWGDFDWAVKLYERCLIPCANYPEFWIRYAELMETKGGREIANLALERATKTFVKRVSTIHLFNARFKEGIGDISSAHAAFLQCDAESDSDFIEVVIRKANMEKRLRNFTTASNTYKDAFGVAVAKGKSHLLPILYINFSQLKYMATKDENAARDILIDGIKTVPSSRLLIEELIKFSMTHGGSRHINAVECIVSDAISPGQGAPKALSAKDAEEISRLYLQFVDLCGTLHDIKMAWNRHIRLFPHSVRKIFYQGMGTKRWKLAGEAKQETLAPLAHQTSIDGISDCRIRSSLQDEKPSSPENNNAKAASSDINQVPDQKSSELESQIMPPELPDQLQSEECAKTLPESEHQASLKISESPASDLLHQVKKRTEGIEASTESSKQCNVEQQYDYDPEENSKPCLKRFSTDPQDTKYPGPVIPTSSDSKAPEEEKSFPNVSHSHEVETSQENSLSCGSLPEGSQNAYVDRAPASPVSSRVAVSSVQVNFESASPSSASNQNILAQAHLQPCMAANSGRNRYQNLDRNRRDSKFGFCGNSHKRFNRHASPRQHRRTEMGPQMPVNQGYPAQTLSSWGPQLQQGNQVQSQYPASTVQANPDTTQSQAYSMQHIQQQNLPPGYQGQQFFQPAMYPQTQMPQNPMQNNAQQHGNAQNNEAYNQMWQYYYYQQQQQQQHLLWQQQPQQQLQLLQQQYQQLVLQMQYLQQQQQLQPEQQQLIMKQQLLQQQMYQQQQHILYLQQQQSSLQLQQPQHQQQLPEQHDHHQQTLPPKQQDHEQGPGKSEQQIDTSQYQDTKMGSANEDYEL